MESLLTVKKLLGLYRVKAASNLSQNFILSSSMTDKIASFLGEDISKNLVIEIGCGPGNLTRSILRKSPHRLYGIEKDPRFDPILQQLASCSDGKFQIFMRNALLDDPYWDIASDWQSQRAVGPNADLDFSGMKVQLIGNLPFNVATPMHLKWMREISKCSSWLWDSRLHDMEMILMFQKEVARRIVAEPGMDSYGRLAVISQAFCNVSYLGTVPSKWFVPRPEVDSGIVKFSPKPNLPNQSPLSIEHLESLTNILMHHPNKLISNNLKIKFPSQFPQFAPQIPKAHLDTIPRDIPLSAILQIGTVLLQANLLEAKK